MIQPMKVVQRPSAKDGPNVPNRYSHQLVKIEQLKPYDGPETILAYKEYHVAASVK
jgi:hypothetical protein